MKIPNTNLPWKKSTSPKRTEKPFRSIEAARIITKDDIHLDEVGVGSVVDVVDNSGQKVTYKILGPWDANPEEHILSFQSKFAQTIMGCKEGDFFKFRDEEYSISKIRSFLGD